MKRIFPVFFIFFFTSCFNQNDCIITSTNLVKIDLFTKAGIARTTTFDSVRLANGTGYFPGYQGVAIGSLIFPLNQDSTESSFVLKLNDTTSYKLKLGYSSFTRVISDDCGAYQYFKDLKVLQTNFDSTRVTSSQLFTSVKQNLKIFF